MGDISSVPPSSFNINASLDRVAAQQNEVMAKQHELENPGLWRSAYETVNVFSNAKEERQSKIEALKNVPRLLEQLMEMMAKAIKDQWPAQG